MYQLTRQFRLSRSKLLCCCFCLPFILANQAQADFLRDLANNLNKAHKQATQKPAYVQKTQQQHILGKGIVTYYGYSKDFQTFKNLLKTGQLEQAYQLKQKQVSAINADFLSSVEAGILAIDAHKLEPAITNFAAGENYLKLLADKSVVEDSLTSFGSEALTVITGIGDLTEYPGEPYERILMLNYKSIAYLLNGERKSYNVTRRAIDWQNIEKKEFDKTLQEVEKKTREADFKKQQQSTVGKGAIDTIFKQYKASESKAMSVPSAYINPFGYYMAGIVQEFDAYEDASLRDNARISYKKALKLNPKSKVIKKAIKATKKAPPKRRRLIQIVAADGFAPEKKTLTYNMNISGSLVAIKLPIFEAVKSSVAKIKIKSGRKTLTTLSTIADIEAISLRHQLDSLPIEHAKVVMSIARNIGENIVWNKFGALGEMGKKFREGFANPDMRAWMTLPKKIMAGRFYAPKNLNKIKIISYDKKGRVLTQQSVSLNKKTHNFVYLRSIENLLYANVAKPLWVK